MMQIKVFLKKVDFTNVFVDNHLEALSLTFLGIFFEGRSVVVDGKGYSLLEICYHIHRLLLGHKMNRYEYYD